MKHEQTKNPKKSNKVLFTRSNDYPDCKKEGYPGRFNPVETHVIQNRKEDHYTGGLLAVAKVNGGTDYNPAGLAAVIDARFYCAKPGGRVYCCAWLNFPATKKHPDGLHISGGGWAGGYGYDKRSAALAEALERAGVVLPWSLAGTGENERALRDIATAAGFKKVTVLRAHG